MQHAPERDNKSYLEDVAAAIDTNQASRGVKGPSVMPDLPNFDPLVSYPPEYLHAWLLGVAKTVARAWFKTSNHKKKWYVGHKIDEVNRKLHEIYPPCKVTRCPQDIQNKLKGAEWKNFALYYSLIVLKNILKKKYYDHWFLFVFAMYMLLKPGSSKKERKDAGEALIKFHDGIEKLYGKKYMTFNVHSLKHTLKFIDYFGALWAWSAFPFEGYNAVIKKLFHGTQCVAEQISKSYFRLRQIRSKSKIFSREGCSEKGKNLFVKLMNSCKVKNCIRYDDDLRLFSIQRYQLTNLE